jgi:hypothetical protein
MVTRVSALALALALALPLRAQTPSLPDQAETARLVWSTLVAVDQANRTGNYTVLRDLGSAAFRQANTAADLSVIFGNLRAQDPGLGRVLSAEPVYREPPRLTDNGQFYIAGSFPGRPTGIAFELLFEQQAGEWRLFGISVGPLAATDPPPAAPAP